MHGIAQQAQGPARCCERILWKRIVLPLWIVENDLIAGPANHVEETHQFHIVLLQVAQRHTRYHNTVYPVAENLERTRPVLTGVINQVVFCKPRFHARGQRLYLPRELLPSSIDRTIE